MVVQLAMGRSNKLVDNDYTLEEQEEIYDMTLDDLYLHARWYLDNLEFLGTYKVIWHNYRSKRPPLPYRHVNKQKKTTKLIKELSPTYSGRNVTIKD